MAFPQQTSEISGPTAPALDSSQQAPAAVEGAKTSATPRPASAAAPRIAAMDFTKGALVLIMVLYHWLNYFYGFEGDIYRYLRFLTPSFIFITGFLVSNVYLSRYGVSDPRPPRRLAQRGLKLLGIFVVLNVVRAMLLPADSRMQLLAQHKSARSLFDVYVRGNVLSGESGKAVAFYILVPIGYLLLSSALLLLTARYFRYVFHVVGALCLATVLLLNAAGLSSANLELLTIGLLAVILGYASTETISSFVRHPYLLAVCYLLYLGAVTLWNVIYPLQIVGVLLTLMILYLVGDAKGEPGRTRSTVILLGNYSLLGYIAQIAILQVLHQASKHVKLPHSALLVVSFVTAFALTILLVQGTDFARQRSVIVARMYRAVFA
jgi:peptidoglycan/LPS O-acetylase OafA/YrhL